MESKNNQKLVPLAKNLRNNMTKEEKHLWYDFLKPHSARFQRQKVLGKYIVDFYCAEANLVIELDGGQHYDDEEIKKDKQRTAFIEEYGLKVIRFPNNEVNQHFDAVCEYIDNIVKKRISEIDN